MGEYRISVEEILKANRLGDEIKQTVAVRTTSMKEIYSVPVHLDAVTLTARASRGAVGATIGAGIGAAVTAKIVSKGTFKVAAKAVAKMAASKMAGAGGGAIIGGVIGSVIPGAGTVVGGVIGGIVGGVLVDATLLKLEETCGPRRLSPDRTVPDPTGVRVRILGLLRVSILMLNAFICVLLPR